MITVGGYRLRILESGSGPAVLLLHGFAGSSEDWRGSVAWLAQAGYRAIAVDCLGFGRSEKPIQVRYSLELISDLYAELLIRLGIECATVAAHSMGGKYALATALRYPQQINRLVLVASDGFAPASPLSRVGGWPWIGTALMHLAAHPLLVRNMLSAAFYAPERHVTAALIEHAQAALSGENRQALLTLSKHYAATDLHESGWRARLSELAIPCLLIWGEEDRIFPMPYAEIAAAEIPNAHLVRIPHCGHFPHIEQPRSFRGILAGFLAAGV